MTVIGSRCKGALLYLLLYVAAHPTDGGGFQVS